MHDPDFSYAMQIYATRSTRAAILIYIPNKRDSAVVVPECLRVCLLLPCTEFVFGEGV